MTSNTQCFVRGLPRFSDSSLDNTLAAEGLEAAWHCAFERFGSKAPEQVSGDFSVALRAPNGAVFLAVDRFAIRTLCYRQVGDTLQFAERADELADASTEIDPQAIFDYLYFHAIPSPRTIYKGIYRVPPAHYVLFENGQLTVAPYWIPAFEEVSPTAF